MSFTTGKKVHCHETFITPDQFDTYSKSGYVIFLESQTHFGTYKAIKITLVESTQPKGSFRN